MPRHKKIRVSAVFSFGLFACITSVLRLIFSIELLDEIDGNVTFQITKDKIGCQGMESALQLYLPAFLRKLQFCRDSDRYYRRLLARSTQMLPTVFIQSTQSVPESQIYSYG